MAAEWSSERIVIEGRRGGYTNEVRFAVYTLEQKVVHMALFHVQWGWSLFECQIHVLTSSRVPSESGMMQSESIHQILTVFGSIIDNSPFRHIADVLIDMR